MPQFERSGPEGSPGDSSGVELSVERHPESVRVTVTGELDLATTPRLDRLLDGLLAGGRDGVVIDLAGVTFMDSTGLGSIVRAHGRAEANGQRFVLRGGSPQVQRLFEITGMLERLAFEE